MAYSGSSRNLQWEGTDLDNDITSYEIFLGNEESTLNSQGTIAETSWNVNAEKDLTYYWQIKTIDSFGNSSLSEVFSFYFN